jgi:RimJ/RimL family protein N-acetyltransferase
MSLGERLTVGEARDLCRSVRTALANGASALMLDGGQLVATDIVGLAAIVQSHRLALAAGIRCAVIPSAQLVRDVIRARAADELTLLDVPRLRAAPARRRRAMPGGTVIACAGRVILRQPTSSDAIHFHRWAQDPLVEQMVGSDLLYLHRHLRPGDSALVNSLVHDPRALTALVEPAGEPHRPRGFVRLYDVDLVSGFGFVETVVAQARSTSRGLGIEAARLLLAFAQDALQLRRIEAKAYAYNVLSVNALRRNGFKQEGVLRKARVYDGEAWDIFVFSILEPEMAVERVRDTFPDFSLFREEVPA